MHENYDDITSRIAEPPAWYDENGTPRYGEFAPDHCPNIYARTIGLFLISCQECGKQFHVEMHATSFDTWRNSNPPTKWHYGDPPRHDCTGAGDSMNCIDLAVLQFWISDRFCNWTRMPDEECVIDATEL